MSLIRRNLLHALAVVSLAVLGWDAFQPLHEVPGSGPGNVPASAPHPPGDAVSGGPPRFTHLTADRMLVPGQRLTVHGRVRDLPPGRPTTVSLEGPDGTMASVELRDDGTREAVFTLQHPTPAIAPGAFSWKLRLNPSDDPIRLGVHVADADRPRVLLLQDHPSVEGARLQRWLGEAGSPVATRTRVSAERYRIASSHGTAVGLERLEAPVLASFDVVVAHAAALDRLSPEEQEVLELTMRRDGLGLLILDSSEPDPDAPSDAPQTPKPTAAPDATRPSPSALASGKSPLASSWLQPPIPSTDAPSGPRETRVHLFNGIQLESPVTVLAAELVVPPGGRTLAHDPQGRPLVGGCSLGRGRVAFSIVQDSWQWRQHGRGDDYAHYWSTLLSTLARPLPASTGAWSMAEASLPAFVDQPISLIWSGAPDTPTPPPTAEVRARGAPDEPAIPLSLTRSPSDPSRGRTVFWPAHPGWHTVRALPSGPTFDLYVHPAQALPEILAQHDSDAAGRTAGEAASLRAVDPAPPPAAGSRPWIRITAFVLFVFSVARLWHSDAATRSRQVQSPHRAPT